MQCQQIQLVVLRVLVQVKDLCPINLNKGYAFLVIDVHVNGFHLKLYADLGDHELVDANGNFEQTEQSPHWKKGKEKDQ